MFILSQFKEFFEAFVLHFYLILVVPVNASIRLTDKEWTDDFLNTTSDVFTNLTRQLQIQVIQ